MGQSHNTGFTDFKKQGLVGVTYRKKIERKWWVVGLEPVCCKIQQKMFLTSYWFVEYGDL